MIARTAARRTAVLGLTALGAVVLATPASAVDVGGVVEQLPPGITRDATGQLVDALGNPVDEQGNPLAVPVPPLPAPVEQAVQAVKDAVAPAAPAPKSAPPPQTQPAQSPPATSAQTATPQTAAPQQAAPPAGGTVTATSIGGMGFAAAPSSIAGFDYAAFRSGSGFASNPMSLFGAPQVALPPSLDDLGSAIAPQVFTPAANALPDLIPVGAPESVPGYLAALACAVVAAAAGAHVAALRGRRASGPAAA